MLSYDEGRPDTGGLPSFVRTPVSDPAARQLIEALNREVLRSYPVVADNHFRLEEDEVGDGNGAFYVVYQGGGPAGCGGVRRCGADEAELKRMYVAPGFRGRGVGAAIMARLERDARELGVSTLLLETGLLLTAAVRLYERAGFTPVPLYGEYVNSPQSLCMAKPLR